MIGTSHHRVPPSVLQAAVTGREELFGRLLRWQSEGRIQGAILLTTCNRVEVVLDAGAAGLEGNPAATELLGDLPHHDHRDADAAHYLLRVAAGLESLVRGEDQILGQLREAFKQSERHGLLSSPLRVLRNQLVAAARDVRQRTGINETQVSVASLAARHLERAGDRLVVIGAGETGRLAVETLVKRANSRVLLVNRTLARAQALARHFGIEAMSLAGFLEQQEQAARSGAAPRWDGLLVAVHSDRAILEARHLHGLKLAIDVSMPCVFAADARETSGVEMLDLDSVQSLAQVESERRVAALATAEDLVRGQSGPLYRAIANTGTSAHLADIVEQHVETALRELQSSFETNLRHLSAADREEVKETLLRATRRNAHHHVKDVRERSRA